MTEEHAPLRVIQEPRFPAIDVRLRRGQHIDAEADKSEYLFIQAHETDLGAFYHSYRCDLINDPQGYWMLVPQGAHGQSVLHTRPLGRPAMMVGLALARILMDPTSIENGWTADREQVIRTMEMLYGDPVDILRGMLPQSKPKSQGKRTAVIHDEVDRALRDLSRLGFVSLEEDGRFRLRHALARFIAPARGQDHRAVLADLSARSQAMLAAPEDAAVPDESDEEHRTEGDGA